MADHLPRTDVRELTAMAAVALGLALGRVF
jgi:hypothetical protein